MKEVPLPAQALRESWRFGRTVYLCGNGGSAANAIRLANDFLYCAGRASTIGLKVEALSANAAVVFTPHHRMHLVEVFGGDNIFMGTDYPFGMAELDPLGLIVPP
jgi:phosphoheptose isomerase